MKKTRFIFLLLLLFSCSSLLHSQTYDFKNYNVEDGLAQSQVLSIFQDHRGNMWLGTNGGGLSKYDGNKFVTYSSKDSLINNLVFSITEDNDGHLFFGTYDGLSVYDGVQFKNFNTKNGLTHNRIFKVLKDRKGTIWIGTAKGVCKYENKHIVPFSADTLLNNLSVFTMYEDGAGCIWFGSIQNGAVKYNPTTHKFTNYTVANGLTENFVYSINEDHKGNILIGCVAGLSSISPGGTITHPEFPGLVQKNIAFMSILKDNQNNIWYSTDNGILKTTGSIYRQFTPANGLPGTTVWTSFQDREGDYWFGTDGFGLSKLSSEMFTNYSENNGLPGEYINAVFQDNKKNYWIGVRNNGVCLLEGKNITTFKLNPKDPRHSLIDNNVQTIAQDKEGNIWLGTKSGISVYKDKGFTNYVHPAGIPDSTIYSIYNDKDNITWIATRNGLSKFSNGIFEEIKAVNRFKGSNDFAIYAICEDRHNNLWLATDTGIIKYNRNTALRYTKKNGFTDKYVYNIVMDQSGDLWLGSEEGVYLYNFSTFKHIDETNGLISNQVFLLSVDENNNLWIGSNKGLSKLNINDFKSKGLITIKHYGKEEGLKGLECNINAQIKDKDGKLWLGTIKGVTVYNPKYDRINTKEALCNITGLRLFFEKADLHLYSKGLDSTNNLPNKLVLPYDKNHITFDFIGVCHENPNKVKYQFKLEGVDADWYPPTSKNEATYSSLQPGEYTFYVKAMNNDGLWNENPVLFKFVVLPPWYRTWWFYSLCGIAIVSGIYFYHDWKTKKLRRNNIKLEKTVTLRTRELREEKEKVELINKEVLEQKEIIEHKNEEITDSIKYAKDIQQALLPSFSILNKAFPDSCVLYMPKDIVSGDFYWFAKRGEKHFVASVDCTGHGVPGAFMSIIGNSLLNEIVTEHNILEPGQILNTLHAGVKTALNQSRGEFERRDGMDIALCAIHKETNTLEYAGANRPLWLFRQGCEGVCEIIKATKFPIGGIELEEKREYTNHSIQLNKGDVFYVFSDGYADQFGGDRGKKMMLGNLQKLLARIYSEPMTKQKEILHKHFSDWKGEHEQVDDVLVIGVRV